jgi:glycerol-3-phosphate responsive antiterminator
VTIDAAVLAEIVTRFAEAIGAVERGNIRAGGVIRERRCVDELLSTGAPPPGCPPLRAQ